MSTTPYQPPTQSGTARRPIRREGRSESRIEIATRGAEPDFAAARRNTGRVRVLRVLLPVLAVGAVVVFYVASQNGPSAVDGPMQFDAVTLDREAMVIERPRLTGYQVGGEAYELTAERAVQRMDNPDLLTLENVQATYELPGGVTAFFSAPAGEYNSVTSFMTLRGGLNMSLDTGVEARLEEITVDVPNGLILSNRPFELTTGNLSIQGNALEMTPDRLFISGGVHTVMTTDGTPAVLQPAAVAP